MKKIEQTRLVVALRAALGLGGALTLLHAGALYAQTTAEPDVRAPTDRTVDRIEVTGSSIRRVDAEGPQPVTVIKREDIERLGSATVSEVLRNLPAQGGFTFDDQFYNGFAPGSSGIGLRNLGQNATLVLVNGRRVANYGFAQNIDTAFVDLNSIPIGAIDRIEVLKDGASAIYGSDAIAGVVNVILRKDYTGAEIFAQYGDTTNGGGAETRISLVGGMGDLKKDRFNVMGVVDYYKRDPIFARDREYSKTADMSERGGFDLRSPTGSPGTWLQRSGTQPGFSVSQPFPSCPPSSITLGPEGGPTCYFNFNDYVTMVPESERKAVYGRFTWDITDNFGLFGEASYNNSKSESFSAPTPGSFALPVGHNSNPWPTPVNIRYRFVDAGPRINNIDTDATRYLIGARGGVNIAEKSWEWELSYLDSKSDSTSTGTNYLASSAVSKLVSQGVYNFVDPSKNPPGLVDSLKITTTRKGISEMKLTDAKASGEIVELPAGPLMGAIGLEYREDDLSDTPDANTQAGNVVGLGGTSAVGSRNVKSAYGELQIPVLKNLELQLAVRYDDYSDFGSTTNPKIAARWQPIKEFMIRGSYGTGFRAPSLVELYQGQSTSFVTFRDNPRCDAYRAGGTAAEISAACAPTQRRTTVGGNPNLQPEESTGWFAGVVWEPTDWFSIGVDYFNIKHDDIIDRPSITYQVDNADLFPGTVNRFAPNARDIQLGAPGALRGASGDEVSAVYQTYFNISQQKVSGWDLEARLRSNFGEYGRLTTVFSGTYNDTFKRAFALNEPLEEYIGTYYYPRWRGVLSFDYEYGPWNASAYINYIHHYYQQNGDYVEYVDSWTTLDLRLKYQVNKNLWFAVGVKNATDEDPPFSDDETSGFDFTQHNPYGRFWYASFNWKFW